VAPQLPAGTVTLLFTDVVGSTRLLHDLGSADYAEALTEHRRVLREVIAAHGGVEVDTQGDAFFIAFPTAGGAAAAARRAIEALADGPIRVRMGLHTGSPSLAAEGYVGLDVHRGARIAALAHGEQILVSPTTAALVDADLLREVGKHRLKDFDGVVPLYQLGDREFPPLRTPGSVELPTAATKFLGREQELFDAVSIVFERDPRVLTVLGPGGVGKTRFAVELARLLAEEAVGGTVFVPLAPLRQPVVAVSAIAETLGASSPDPAAIAARVGDRRTHVVCDNAEHLLPDAARPLAELVAAVPMLRLFVTSREALRIQGEVELDLAPLVSGEAVALFCERAQAVRADVGPSPAVAQLCERLDRLPLALELAAARTKLLSPHALLERLGDRLDGLKGTRDVEDRHTTLRTTIAWSHDLLNDEEQRLFARLGVFRAGCTLETAELVCDAELETLASLLDKSLLRRRTGRAGEERYWMLETIREFAVERLEDLGESQELRRRHAERMLAICRSAELGGEGDVVPDLATGVAELDDLRGALDWAEEHDAELGLQIAVESQNLWNSSAPEEAMGRLERLLARAGEIPAELRARALLFQGGATDLAGHDAEAEGLTSSALSLFRALGDDWGVATAEHMLAVAAWRRGDWDRMRELTHQSLEIARGRFTFMETANYWLLGQLALNDGDLEEATKLTRRSAGAAQAAGWAWWESGQRHELLMLALRRGDLDEAEREGLSALRMEFEQGNRLWALYTLAGLAQAAQARGDLERAGVLWGAAENEGERLPRWPDERARRGGALPEEAREPFLAGVERGRQLDLWDAAAFALGES
jgi:predicted ATPase/class 3 adenylate cyclase